MNKYRVAVWPGDAYSGVYVYIFASSAQAAKQIAKRQYRKVGRVKLA